MSDILLDESLDALLERVAQRESGTIAGGMNGEMVVVIYIRVGDYPDKQRLENMLAKLKSSGFSGLVRVNEVEDLSWVNPKRWMGKTYRIARTYTKRIEGMELG